MAESVSHNCEDVSSNPGTAIFLSTVDLKTPVTTSAKHLFCVIYGRMEVN